VIDAGTLRLKEMVLEENNMLAHVVMGLMFFPRGGSAHVTRSLARELVKLGCKVTILWLVADRWPSG